MALQLPSFAKIVELQLAIRTQDTAMISEMRLTRAPNSGHTEMWGGQISLATMTRENGRKLAAFLEAHDGQVEAFLVPANAGYSTHAVSYSGTLQVAAVAGADTITVNNATDIDIHEGTLLRIGTAGSAGYQVVEVLVPVRIGPGNTLVSVAPRIRSALAAGVAVSSVDVLFALNMTSDTHGVTFGHDRAIATLEVQEAIL